MTCLLWVLLSVPSLPQTTPSDGADFSLPLTQVSAEQARQATFVRRPYETVVYLPGAGAGMGHGLKILPSGPIASVRTFVAARGVALTLKQRGRQGAPSALRLVTEPSVVLCAGAGCTTPPHVTLAANKSTPLRPATLSEASQSAAAPESRSWAWLENARHPAAAAAPKTPLSGLQTLALVAACGGAALLLLLLRRRQGRSMPPGSAIRVLSVQSMGGKHRLALVETCGERLLLAITDTDVSVLTQVTADSAAAATLAESFTAEAAAQPAPNLATVASSTAPKAYEVDDGGDDVAGLRRLRRANGPSHLSVVQ